MVYKLYNVLKDKLKLSNKLKFDDSIVGNYHTMTYTHDIVEETTWKGRYKHGQKRYKSVKLFLFDNYYISGYRAALLHLMKLEILSYYDRSI